MYNLLYIDLLYAGLASIHVLYAIGICGGGGGGGGGLEQGCLDI